MYLGVVVRYVTERIDDSGLAFQARVSGYEITLLTEHLTEFLAFHWHPHGQSRVTAPHIHVATTAPVDLSKAHIPSGEVTFQQVLRFAIEELGVESLRQDWRTVLN